MELGGTKMRPGVHLLLTGQPPGGAYSTSGFAQGTRSPAPRPSHCPSCRDLGQLWALLGPSWQVDGHVAWAASSGGMRQGEARRDRKSRHTPSARPASARGGSSPLGSSPAAGRMGLPTSRTSHKIEKPFLLKNLEGKSHIIIVKILS